MGVVQIERGEGVQKMYNQKNKLENAMMDFCIRVLSGNNQPQEVAILPEILDRLLEELETQKRIQA